MKIRTMVMCFALIITASSVRFAAAGDLTVNGMLDARSGVKFPDGSIQTSARSLVWDYTVTGSPVTSVTSTMLNGVADGGYEFEFWIENSTSSAALYRLYYNDDTTNSNYFLHGQFSYSGASDAYNNAEAYINPNGNLHAAGKTLFLKGSINQSPAGMKVSEMQGMMYLSTYYVQFSNIHRHISSTDNLISIKVVSNVANGIGINSRFRLWKRIL